MHGKAYLFIELFIYQRILQSLVSLSERLFVENVFVIVSHLSPAHCAPSAHGSCSTRSHPSCRCGPRGC